AKPSADRVGATRLNGRRAVVLQAIPSGPHATGRVRVEREEWRAESADGGSIEPGQTVVVLRVDGTRLIVRALETFEEHL
ncbi:MAG: NfeD family protein, partial [Acidimicrobiia bacterium]